MRARWHTQFVVLEGSSNFHKTVGQILATDPLFRHSRCFQEVPIKDLVPDYGPDHRLDWYLADYNVCLELHGAQHYKATSFGSSPVRKVEEDFRESQYRDNLKKTALVQAGYVFREVHYRLAKRLNPELLKAIIFSEEQ
jgi:hypothetical protein